MFTQWIDGQPWWVTLLLLPALVLAAIATRVVRYALLIGAAVATVALAVAVWSWRRRR